MHGFVKIMKYNDLNLWSVKASAQKAHKQLFCFLKQFRLSGSDLVAPLFDEIPPIPSTSGCENKAAFASDRIMSCNEFYAKRAINLALKIGTHFMDSIYLENIQEVSLATYHLNRSKKFERERKTEVHVKHNWLFQMLSVFKFFSKCFQVTAVINFFIVELFCKYHSISPLIVMITFLHVIQSSHLFLYINHNWIVIEL